MKIPVHKYAAWRTISYPDLTRQLFRKMCRDLQKSMKPYYDGISGERDVTIRVAKYVPTHEDYIVEAQERNAALADQIIEKIQQIVTTPNTNVPT